MSIIIAVRQTAYRANTARKEWSTKTTSTTSRRPTETLKKAHKERYFTDTGDLTTCFSHAWKWPQHIDWEMTGPVATSLYDEASQLVGDLLDDGKTLTVCQQRLLQD